MSLNELIFKRLSEDSKIKELLARFNGTPAVFDTEFPGDEEEGWEGRQYPRISYRTDMQINQERSAAGNLHVSIYTDKESLVIDELEDTVKRCLQDVLMKPSCEAPFCVSWMKTEGFIIEGTEIVCKNIVFDILEYGSQVTTDPDPVLAVANYIKNLFPDTMVIGLDDLYEQTNTAQQPVFFCRLVNIRKTTGHCEHSISWHLGKLAVHLIYPDAEARLQMLAEVYRRLSIDEEIIMLDDSPMMIEELSLDNKSDYLREGQLIITGKYGCLKDNEKMRAISGIEISTM